MKKIAIIGAGISGISLSSMLNKISDVTVFEKSRQPGGRMCTRTKLSFDFDHGVQFFKISTLEFKNFLNPLFEKGIIKPWVHRYAKIEHNEILKINYINSNDNFFVGVPKMNSITHELAQNCKINLNNRICYLNRKNNKWELYNEKKDYCGNYDWVILTMPVEQICSIIPKNICFFDKIDSIKMKSCYSLMVGLNNNLDLDYDTASVKDEDISWIAVNSSKPNRRKGKFSLVINSSYDYAEKNKTLNDEKISNHLLNVASKIMERNLSQLSLKVLHKWNYVESVLHPKEDFFVDLENHIATCGDWCANSRVEGAYLSALSLYKSLSQNIF